MPRKNARPAAKKLAAKRKAKIAARPKKYPRGERVLITPQTPLSTLALANLAALAKLSR
ncbi:hypothetical protein MACH17_22380 [Phaeobacter inhibens]|uniref:hypothetical protein n=1 Tax=Phaeobacter inhibens TaxID=221822 RepID=UPI002763B0ED|nr:hypothetical protein [Phaeobacter inhibens]GLO70721.1 hypothetical protein MACH17_22380 [Phaeobacter inhibens]